jgi:hypothetical protein
VCATRALLLQTGAARGPRAAAMGDAGTSLAVATWDGAIPLCLSLDAHEVATQQAPPCMYVLAPRGTYLPLLTAAAAAHFRDALPAVGEDAVWFDAGGLPLKAQLPTGVLFDLLGRAQVPWRLNVHFRAYPEGTLLQCAGADAVRGALFNALKARGELSAFPWFRALPAT